MIDKKIDVVILAGGLGTRLRPVVSEVPKCMATVCGKPFLYYLLKYLSRFSIEKVILSVGYLRNKIFDWVESEGKNFPFSFEYAVEEAPLGTGGGIKLSMAHAASDIVCVLNGDTFFDVDLNVFLAKHKESNKPISIALKPLRNFERYGTVETNSEGVVTRFREKAFCKNGQINGGVYLIDNNGLLDTMPDKFSFELDFLQPQAELLQVSGFVEDKYFIDIGVPEDYAKANDDFKGFIQ